MGSKSKLMIIIAWVLLLCLILVAICSVVCRKEEDYSAKLISVVMEQKEVTVQDVFTFNFERAYIFNDCYISGEGFAERYNLDISIAEVKSGVSENIQRIVFVDGAGNFVYELRCDTSEVILAERGTVIYPDTTIKSKTTSQQKPFIICFQSNEYYDTRTGDGYLS